MAAEFTPSRRSVAKGIAWSAPAVALGAAAPLAQASEVPEPGCPTPAEISAGVCSDGFGFSVGSTPSYSSLGGGWVAPTFTFNFNMFANCYEGAVNYHWNQGQALLTVRKADGTEQTYVGNNTLGQVSAGGAKIGTPTSTSYIFPDARNLPTDADFTISLPMQFNYPGGHTCNYRLVMTPPERHLRTPLVRNPGPITFVQA